MKRFLMLVVVGYLLFGVISYSKINAADGYAECDLCGYCPTGVPTPPGSWESCRKCLYPSANPTPYEKDTLKVNPTDFTPPTAFPGHQYTQLGCIQTNLGGLDNGGGDVAANVVQALLNIIFGLVGGVALLYFIYGTFLILTSHGSPEQLAKGRRTMISAVIGLVFALLSVFIVRFIGSGLLRIPGFE